MSSHTVRTSRGARNDLFSSKYEEKHINMAETTSTDCPKKELNVMRIVEATDFLNWSGVYANMATNTFIDAQ